jgi:hypothetical protein
VGVFVSLAAKQKKVGAVRVRKSGARGKERWRVRERRAGERGRGKVARMGLEREES